jgi:uncharacterized membrane protein
MSVSESTHWLARLGRLDAHQRQWIALPVGIAAAFILPEASALTRFINAWDFYATLLLILAWVTICTHDPAHAQRATRLQDSGRAGIFTFVLLGVGISMLAVLFTLHVQKSASDAERSLHLGQTLFTVLVSWTLVHTLFALHYAHVFYRALHARPSRLELDIPGGKNPDYLDFAYFSFVIGATAQTADINISGSEMRRLVLLHGVISFLFNTLILALSINMLASLL